MAGLFSKLLNKAKKPRPRCGAVVPAAGSASRMEGVDKLTAQLGDRPVLARTLGALEACPLIDEIVVVTREEQIPTVAALAKEYGITKVKTVVKGGADRAESVALGLKELSPDIRLAAVHDGARPFVSQEVLEEVITVAGRTGAAVPAVPVKDTIKEAEDGIVTRTLERSRLFAVQTPQVIDADLLRGALQYCREQGIAVTDDCSAVEAMGKEVTLTKGEYENIKITTPIDLAFGEAILSCQQH
jgi:2-C-methyl-D-erythritol 4-phosphate cytidylyltransferase